MNTQDPLCACEIGHEPMIEGLDFITCERCGVKTVSPHRVRDDVGTFRGHVTCAQGFVQHATALNH